MIAHFRIVPFSSSAKTSASSLETSMRVDNRARSERARTENLERAFHVAQAKMKRRQQRQVVVMHPPRVHIECSSGRASAKKHHPPSAPHPTQRLMPSVELPGAFDDQIRPEAVVEARDFALRIAAADIDNPIGVPGQPPTSSDHHRAQRWPPRAPRAGAARADVTSRKDPRRRSARSRRVRAARFRGREPHRRAAPAAPPLRTRELRACETRCAHDVGAERAGNRHRRPAPSYPSPARKDFPGRADKRSRFRRARSARPSARRQL